MNKKGFTLVELLAVIAILAILVVFAVPNILSSFSETSKKAFYTQAQNIYKIAEQQVIVNQIKYSESNISRFYSSGSDKEKLDMEAMDVSYCIKFNDGKISSFVVSDNRYSVSKSSINSAEDITKNDVASSIEINSCN